MLQNLQIFKKLLRENKIKVMNKNIDKIIHEYSFYYLSKEDDLNSNPKLCKNLQDSKLIIVKYHSIDPHFILGFEKTILIIQRSSLFYLQSLLSNNKEIFFLENSKQIFDKYIEIEYIKSETNTLIEKELFNLNSRFEINSTQNTKIIPIIQPCINGYLLKVGYSKLNKNRSTEISNSNNHQNIRKIDEDEYIEIRLINSGSSFQTLLIFFIEMEELLIIKKYYEADEKIPELVQREMHNYEKIKHPLIPKYYGTTTRNNCIIIEYINGQNLTKIKEFHFSVEEKLTIIFQLLSIVDYLHEQDFIYRDLKPDNVMIDENKTAILIDFDRMITKNEQKTNQSNTNTFCSIFQAPEINSNKFDEKSDIYSIGQMIYYLINEEIPNQTINTKFKIDESSEISKIYQECTNDNPEYRPSTKELINHFCDFISKTKYIMKNINSKIHFKLGNIYYEGRTIPHDINKAIYYYSLAANLNHLEAQFNLGYIYEKGESIPRDINKAIYYYSLAANLNYLEAQFNLGVIYEEGESIPRDINKAIHYYSLAANQNCPEAQLNLGDLYEEGESIPRDIDKAIFYYTLAANQNCPEAQFILGAIYEEGESIPRDIDKAIYYYTLAANQNYLKAQYKLGIIYSTDEFVPQDINKAIHYYSLAANQNLTQAQFNLGLIYCEGILVPRDINKAIHYFSLATNENDYRAQFILGYIYSSSKLVPQDINKGIHYYSLAANQNFSKAQLFLGEIYEEGESIPQDINKAIHYYLLAANQNDSEAQFRLGFIYFEGKLISQDMKKAIYYFSLSANQNLPNAQYSLGLIYYEGYNIQRNVYKGIDLIMQSSKNDFILAHFPLGFFYHEGKYLERDIKKAVSLYKEGSSFNDQYSKNNLGILYKNGFGEEFEKKWPISIIYFEEAIKQKNDKISKYNLSHVYIYEESTIESIKKSIKYLIESIESDFEPSEELLCLALIKIYGIDIDSMKKEISQYTKNPDKFISSIQKKIYLNELYNSSNFNIFFENQKYIDFLYNATLVPIISRYLYKKEEIPKTQITGLEITNEFYEGFI